MTTVPLMILLAVAASPQAFRNATVVSTDVPHLTLTIKGDKGPNEVVGVDTTALARLKALKAGDEVILTLRTDGDRLIVTTIEPSLGGRKTKARPGQRRSSARPPASPASPAAPGAPAAPSAVKAPAEGAAKVSPAPEAGRLPTDTVGPLQDPRRGAQQDPRDNPVRDPRVIPGLTQPAAGSTASPTPSPSPTQPPTP